MPIAFWAVSETLFRVKGNFMKMSWRESGSAQQSCSWNNGKKMHLGLPRGRMILAISDHLLLSSLGPSTADHIDP